MTDPAPRPATRDETLEAIWLQAATAGRPMPGESTLAADLSMSRAAVREALVRLEERGYLRRRKGAGTVVNPSLLDIPARFDLQVDKSDLIAATGRTPAVEILGSELSPITVDEAVQFRIAPGTPVFRIRKLWRADGDPVMLARDAVPVRRRPPIPPAADHTIFTLATELADEHPEWEIAWPAAEALDEPDARLLGRHPGDPMLSVELTGIGRSGQVAYWSSELHIPGALRYALVRSIRHP
ncbi:GntR family transcriptional regulator [Nocardia sp. alder85J]|uniref:GntR family transcriptional regulator n=1 Tax=Nocardia sp. alder85J TaxID=2862949 RepID=UPI001CD7FD33|nr:GntR family transcriptional regulator [Nocardia sp. alder85J]MCX4092865.1 GntR family transcriptional regulator [Nocardia sp. alder85J]